MPKGFSTAATCVKAPVLYFDAASDEFMYLQNVPTRMTGRVLWPSLLEVAMLFRLPYPKNFPNCCQQRLGPRKNTWRQAKQTGLGGKQARWSTPVTIKKRFDITRAVIDKKALTDPFCGDIFGFLGQKSTSKPSPSRDWVTAHTSCNQSGSQLQKQPCMRFKNKNNSAYISNAF